MPKRIVVQGGGYIAVEFACIFAGLGSEVTLVYRGENILRGFDDDIREHLRLEMETRGIKVLCGHTVDAVEKAGDEFSVKLSDGTAIAADKVMFAIGRRPSRLRTIAVARIVMPGSHVRLSAGRQSMSDEMQALCFFAGANSMFCGERLLTAGNPSPETDRSLFGRLGLKPE